jgi:hypothetical protein
LHDGIWRDEAFAFAGAGAPTLHEFLHNVTDPAWHSPLYFAVEYAWSRVAGSSALSLTILPFLFSVATVAMVYRLGAEAGSRNVGALAAATYAVAPLPVEYSTEHVYALAGLLATTLAWLVIRARRQPDSSWALGALPVTAILLALTLYTAFAYTLLLIVWALIWGRVDRRSIAAATAMLAGPVASLLFLPAFLRQLATDVPFQAPADPLSKATFFPKWVLEFMPVRPLALECVVLLLIVAGIVLLVVHRVRVSEAGSLGIVFLAVLLVTTALEPPDERYAIAYCALLYVALAQIFIQLIELLRREDPAGWEEWGKAMPLVLAAIFVATDVEFAVQKASVPKSGIATFAATKMDGSTLYVIAPDYIAPTFAFYTRSRPVTYRGFIRLSNPHGFPAEGYDAQWGDRAIVDHAVNTILHESKKFHYVVVVADQRALRMPNPYRQTAHLLALLRSRYSLVGIESYAGRMEPVSVYRFMVQ